MYLHNIKKLLKVITTNNSAFKITNQDNFFRVVWEMKKNHFLRFHGKLLDMFAKIIAVCFKSINSSLNVFTLLSTVLGNSQFKYL